MLVVTALKRKISLHICRGQLQGAYTMIAQGRENISQWRRLLHVFFIIICSFMQFQSEQWRFPKMGVPPNHFKLDHFSIETNGEKPPCTVLCFFILLGQAETCAIYPTSGSSTFGWRFQHWWSMTSERAEIGDIFGDVLSRYACISKNINGIYPQIFDDMDI